MRLAQISLLDSLRRRKLIETLRLERKRARAARKLGISRTAVWAMLRRWHIEDREWQYDCRSEWKPLDHYLSDVIWHRLQRVIPEIPVAKLHYIFEPKQVTRPQIEFWGYTETKRRVHKAAEFLGLPPIIDVHRMNHWQIHDLLACAHLCFRKQSLAHHPDKGGDEDRFKNLNHSFQVIQDYAEYRGVSSDLPAGNVQTQDQKPKPNAGHSRTEFSG